MQITDHPNPEHSPARAIGTPAVPATPAANWTICDTCGGAIISGRHQCPPRTTHLRATAAAVMATANRHPQHPRTRVNDSDACVLCGYWTCRCTRQTTTHPTSHSIH